MYSSCFKEKFVQENKFEKYTYGFTVFSQNNIVYII